MPMAHVLRTYPSNMYSEVTKYYRAYFEENGKPEAFPPGSELSVTQRKFLSDIVDMNLRKSPDLSQSTAFCFSKPDFDILQRGIVDALSTIDLAAELHCSKQNISRIKCKLYQKMAVCLANSVYWADHMNINSMTISDNVEKDLFNEGDTFYILDEKNLEKNMKLVDSVEDMNYLPKNL